MKLGALNSAIRKMDGAPKTNLNYKPDGMDEVELFDLDVSKQSLLAAIKRAFPDGAKNTETGLRIKDTGHIVPVLEGDETPAAEDAIDDILG